MKSIAIIGSGQAALPLAINLIRTGYIVNLFSDRSASQIRSGRILSSQGMFHTALQLEQKWGLNYWDKQCPWNTSITFTAGVPSKKEKAIYWKGRTSCPYQSIDQRMKFSRWLDIFEQLGGKLNILNVGLEELDQIAKWHDLTIVAGGKGSISQIFPRNAIYSVFNVPMRALACMYVKNMQPIKDEPGVRVNIIPRIGEYFTMPGLSIHGHCEMMLFEGIPGGPFDCWQSITSVEEQLTKGIEILKEFIPWEAERCENLQLTDSQATLTGCYTPTIREPIAKMPCGKFVLGMGDTVVLNDPIAGQGANNAAKCADIYFNQITARGNDVFDEAWMQATFNLYWHKVAKAATKWSTMLLLPPPPHVLELMNFASTCPALADKISDGFDDPNTLLPWIADPNQTKTFIKEIEENTPLYKKTMLGI